MALETELQIIMPMYTQELIKEIFLSSTRKAKSKMRTRRKSLPMPNYFRNLIIISRKLAEIAKSFTLKFRNLMIK